MESVIVKILRALHVRYVEMWILLREMAQFENRSDHFDAAAAAAAAAA
jgi:hypothetical protein